MQTAKREASQGGGGGVCVCCARGALSRLGRIVCSGFSLCVGRHRHRRRRRLGAPSSSSSRLFSASSCSSSTSASTTSCSAFFRSIFIQLEICCTIKRASWRFLASSQFGSSHVHACPHTHTPLTFFPTPSPSSVLQQQAVAICLSVSRLRRRRLVFQFCGMKNFIGIAFYCGACFDGFSVGNKLYAANGAYSTCSPPLSLSLSLCSFIGVTGCMPTRIIKSQGAWGTTV